jgi:hypothetical protein
MITFTLTVFTSTASRRPVKMARKHPFELRKCARPNILKLQPYRCARE